MSPNYYLEPPVGVARALLKMATRKALHFVFKVADRTATAKFYREILGMKVSTGIYLHGCR